MQINANARAAHLSDLRFLLSSPSLGEIGMGCLKDTLEILLPDLALSTIET